MADRHCAVHFQFALFVRARIMHRNIRAFKALKRKHATSALRERRMHPLPPPMPVERSTCQRTRREGEKGEGSEEVEGRPPVMPLFFGYLAKSRPTPFRILTKIVTSHFATISTQTHVRVRARAHVCVASVHKFAGKFPKADQK
ncbi:hypothetical protein PUN28_016364 [Cardiocondyla obscurior]|uniref:Uncharacterized protein n=1 Tax=Cardiocondyla obscurior TaxID=286306 RepID=A0AAW2EXH1_9HYME